MNPRTLAVVAAALLALLAVVETGTALTASARVATAADWQAAAAEVRADLQPGDLIVFAPQWADQVGRSVLGDVIPVEMAARSDADRYARVWEVAIRGAHAPEIAGARLVHGGDHGRVHVALYEKSSVSVLYDFTARADEARVTQSQGSAAAETPCYHDSGAIGRCPGSRVERRTLEIDYRPRRGILAPADNARTTHIDFSEVPLGKSLVVYAGIHDYYARKNSDALVDFRVTIDGKPQLALHVGNDDRWSRFEIDTAALAGTRHDVRFDVAAGNPQWRNMGFHAEARR